MRFVLIPILFAASCSGQTLTDYFSLTSAQRTSITQLNRDYSTYLNGQQQQISTLNQQLQQLYTGGTPDPLQLGNRYVQIEMINRDEAAHLSTLQTQVAAQLTSAQAALIPALSQSITLAPLASDAACGFLMNQTSPALSLAGFLLGYPYLTVPNQWFNISGAPFPVIPPAPSGTFCGSSTFPVSIREYMSVTDAQVAALAAASASYNDYYIKMQDQMNDLYVNIRDETAKPSPDPATLGLFYTSLAAIGQNITNQGAVLRQQALAFLSDSQKATLKTLEDSSALQQTAIQAIACNMMVTPPGSSPTYISYNCQL